MATPVSLVEINILATAKTSAMPSSLPEKMQSSAKDMLSTTASNSQAFLMQEQLSLQEQLARQQEDDTEASPSYVCEWASTNMLLPTKSAEVGGQTYLCLPVHLSEASYFKQNEEKEEFKDDGYCTATVSQLRMMYLDQYLAAVAPLASSTRNLLHGGKLPLQTKVRNTTITGSRHRNRRTKYERQHQLPMSLRLSPPNHHLITSTNSGRVINVIQGEIAHCTPSQADTLVSDDATTCHIVALWSRWLGSDGVEGKVLATMTHIDGPGYEASIRDAVNEHVKYHSMHLEHAPVNGSEEFKENCSYQVIADKGIIDMSVHIMGGFNDSEGSSIAITDNVLHTFAALSNEYGASSLLRGLPIIRMTLETCAVASANDDGTCCPLGRGLGMDVATGSVFLAEVEEVGKHQGCMPSSPSVVVASMNGLGMVAVDGDIQLFNNVTDSKYISALGPEVTLRSVRLWASAFHSRGRSQEGKLNIIYHPNADCLCIEPFFFGPHFSGKILLNCDDRELLSLTSTSPEVEKTNFVAHVRESLAYMNGTNSSKVFPFGLPMKFQRVGLNGWVQCS